MSDAFTALVVACITSGVTILGWNVLHHLTRKREDRRRGIELRIAELDRKYEEFYGPLYSLIQQVLNAWKVRLDLEKGLDDSERQNARFFIWKEHFLHLHLEIRDLLKTKLYLVSEGDIPDSFKEYLEHSTQELFRHNIEKELQVKINSVKAIQWPSQFPRDVEREIENILSSRQQIVDELNSAYKLEEKIIDKLHRRQLKQGVTNTDISPPAREAHG